MADFLLSVGVDTGLSYTQMQKDITALVVKLNSNPPKIKVAFDVDKSTAERLQSQMAGLHKAASAAGGTNTGSTAIDNVAKNIKSANSGLSETIAKLSAVNAALKEIQTTNSSITSAYKALKSTLGGEAATGQNETVLSVLRAKYIELQTAAESLKASKASATQEDISNIRRIQSEMQLLINSTQERMRAEREAAAAARTAANAEIADIKKKQAVGADENASAKRALEERQSLLKKSHTLLSQMQTAERNWTAAKNGKSSLSYAAIQGNVVSLQELIKKYGHSGKSLEEFRTKLSKLSASFKENSTSIRGNADNSKTLLGQVGSLSAKFSTWFGITRVLMTAYQTAKKMVSAVIELDTAMTELKKVTNETDVAYDAFLERAADRAKMLGATLADTVTATADFARLGYNLDEASKLADTSIIYKNVGDGLSDITEASESIIATMQAFGMAAGDAMSIVDRFNEVGKLLPNNTVMY